MLQVLVVVPFQILGLSFLIVSDFTSVSDVLVNFAPGESLKTVTIETAADDIVESIEQFSAIISAVSERVIITEDTANISILETGSGECKDTHAYN